MHKKRTFVIILSLFLALAMVALTFVVTAAQNDEELREILRERGMDEADLSDLERRELLDDLAGRQPLAPAASGGPDAFGYTYLDSVENGGPAFDWVELSGTGAISVPLEAHSRHGPFDFGFDFNFYGDVYTGTWMGSNGWLSIGHADPGLADSTNDCPLPSSQGLENIIAGIWDNLTPDTGTPAGVGYYQAFAPGACPYGAYAGACFVAQWDGMYHFDSAPPDDVTFEIILFDDDNILVQIQDAGEEAGTSSTTGIENADGTIGLTYGACETAGHLSDNLAIRFQYPPPAPNLFRSYMTGPWLAAAGDPLTYTLFLSNTGTAPANQAELSNPIPAETTFVADSLSCESGTCAYDAGSDTVNWSGAIDVGETVVVSFAVAVAEAACNETIVNSAALSDPAAINSPYALSQETTAWETFLFSSDFESGDGGFVANTPPGSWAWGDLVPSADAPPAAHSGTKLWATDLNGPIPVEPSQHYLTKTLALPVLDNAALIWWDWWDEDGLDTGSVTVNATEVYTIEFDQHAWQAHAVALGAYAEETVEIVFLYDAEGVNTSGAGWYVDDVTVAACGVPPEASLQYLPAMFKP